MDPVRADSARNLFSAYVHIPFCSAVCPYCDFAVVAGRDDLVAEYARALVAEIEMSEWRRPLGAVYFGGGTPTHVSPDVLGEILHALVDHHGIDGDAEVSVEANPEDFTSERAAALMRIGFNRVSFGAQSFDGAVLIALGRRHGPDAIARSVEAARHAGFDNVSLDLIYGTPGETMQSWETTIGAGLAADPDHVSCYALTVEPGTPLGRSVRDGLPGPDPDLQADFFEYADRTLHAAGFDRYEVSNWSRPGRECLYNLGVWAQGEYEAYGNGAHRFVDGIRSNNARRIDTYLERLAAGQRPIAGADPIDGWDRELDRLFVGLRRTVGVAAGPGVDAFTGSDEGRRLIRHGVVTVEDDRLRVVRPLLTDEVHRVALALSAPGNGSRADNV
jgi:oxygen-independent coproporphyrinogen-3 oxidase